jgi:hypothetical protein
VSEVGGLDAADSDGALSSITGHSVLGALLAGGSVGAVSGGGGVADAGFGYSLMHPPGVSPNRKRDRAAADDLTYPASYA